jgi:hypothetical protein
MPYLDRTGPLKRGQKSGRCLGYCHKMTESEVSEKVGIGMGLRRKSGGGQGLGKRLKRWLK